MEFIDSIVLKISDFLYQPWLVPLILLGGAFYFTIRTRFMQVRLFI